MKKELHSQFHKTGWTSDNGILYPVECLPVAELWASVPKAETLSRKPFYETVKADIAADGLIFPLLCVHLSREEILKAKKRYDKSLCDLPFDQKNPGDLSIKHYVIWGGSNRVRIAEELGYTHVDCAMIPELKTAHHLQRDMRKPFKKRYYSALPHSENNRVKRV